MRVFGERGKDTSIKVHPWKTVEAALSTCRAACRPYEFGMGTPDLMTTLIYSLAGGRPYSKVDFLLLQLLALAEQHI